MRTISTEGKPMYPTQDSPKTCPNTQCPSYGQPVQKYRDPSGVELDRCGTCRTDILDAGELQAIIKFAVDSVRAHSGGGHVQPYQRPVAHHGFGHGSSSDHHGHRGYRHHSSSDRGGLFGGFDIF